MADLKEPPNKMDTILNDNVMELVWFNNIAHTQCFQEFCNDVILNFKEYLRMEIHKKLPYDILLRIRSHVRENFSSLERTIE